MEATRIKEAPMARVMRKTRRVIFESRASDWADLADALPLGGVRREACAVCELDIEILLFNETVFGALRAVFPDG